MKRVLKEMSSDPEVSRARVFGALISDAVHGMSDGFWTGMLGGATILVVWYVGRSHHPVHIGLPLGLSVIALVLLAAGFIGASRSGSLLGGLWSGLVAGFVSALTVPGDRYVFGFWISDTKSLILTVLVAGTVVMMIVLIGAASAGADRHQRRVRRSARAFVAAWRQAA
jgi:hypothetical protein